MVQHLLSRTNIAVSCFFFVGLCACSSSEHEQPSDDSLLLQATIEPNDANVLIADANVQTEDGYQVAIEVTSAETTVRETARSSLGTNHDITIFGLRADTVYSFTPILYVDDQVVHRGANTEYKTDPLPVSVPPIEVTVTASDLVQPGITFLGPSAKNGENDGDQPLYLGLDEAGEVVWYYDSDRPEDYAGGSRDLKVLADGNYLISVAGGYRIISPAGETIQQFDAASAGFKNFHHDGIILPNGHFLALAEETREMEVPFASGWQQVTGDIIIELDETGSVVWQWSTFDHLDTSRFPGPLSKAAAHGSYDWTHSNALAYDAEDDAILLSVRHQNWVVKISHATGQVIWRLGAEGDFELTNSDDGAGWFYSQHAPELLAYGSILVYDNGNERPEQATERYSRAVIYQLDEHSFQATQLWQYQTDYYTSHLGDVDQQANDNILICAGGQGTTSHPAQVVEVTEEHEPQEVWKLNLDGYNIYRASKLSY